MQKQKPGQITDQQLEKAIRLTEAEIKLLKALLTSDPHLRYRILKAVGLLKGIE